MLCFIMRRLRAGAGSLCSVLHVDCSGLSTIVIKKIIIIVIIFLSFFYTPSSKDPGG